MIKHKLQHQSRYLIATPRIMLDIMKVEVLVVVKISVLVFWIVMPCGLVGIYLFHGYSVLGVESQLPECCVSVLYLR
jgi:hypothetical protein